MDAPNREVGERPALQLKTESSALDIIRTETVLSKLPVHNLAKTGRVDIRILKTTATGEVELKWDVSFNERYGQARQLAYKLDTIVINRRIDEAGRPLPRMLRIGSLSEICSELGTAHQGGKSKIDLKRAFLQNASAFINAKFSYKGNDGTEQQIEAALTRYNVIFTGEKLSDGRRADAVYVVFNDPFWGVLNNAPVRPLDRAYMKSLPPAAQRFYEIISRKIFAALKNNYPYAKLLYSEYCTFSAQLRHFDRQPVQDQMAKVLRHHKASGYITAVKYDAMIDTENRPDWMMHFTPGPKAHAEFATVNRGYKRGVSETKIFGMPELTRHRVLHERREGKKNNSTVQPVARVEVDPILVAELGKRGIGETDAKKILVGVAPDQPVLTQLEWGDLQVQRAQGKITNPAGLYISILRNNSKPPPTFESSADRRAREEQDRVRDEQRRAQEELETEYAWYCDQEIDRFISNVPPEEVAAVRQSEWQTNREKYQSLSAELIDTLAAQGVRRELGRRASFMTIAEFKVAREQGTDFLLKPVPGSAVSGMAEADERREAAVHWTGGNIPTDAGHVTVEPAPERLPEATMPAIPLAPSAMLVQDMARPEAGEQNGGSVET